MKRILMAALVGIVVSGPALSADAKGEFTGYHPPSCADYSDGYSQAELTGKDGYSGGPKTVNVMGWMDGYVSFRAFVSV